MSGEGTSATAKIAKPRRTNSGRGSKPGERRGGRIKGVPNKATISLREAAREYTQEALQVLFDIAIEGDSEAARVSAANAILDRGYGKPAAVVAGDEDGGPIATINRIILEGVLPK